MEDLDRARSIAEGIANDGGDLRLRADLSMLRGLLHGLLLDFGEAADYLTNGMQLYAQVGASGDVAVCKEYLGLVRYFAGDYSEARQYYRAILDSSEPTASAVAQTLRMLTDAYIAEGRFKEALATEKKAEEALTSG
jgi:tetratricopeptide (TPR) repeat protein